MKYMLLIYRDEAQVQAMSEADARQMQAAYMAYTEAMTRAGVHIAGDRLRPRRFDRSRISVEPSVPAAMITTSANTNNVGASNASRPESMSW